MILMYGIIISSDVAIHMQYTSPSFNINSTIICIFRNRGFDAANAHPVFKSLPDL